MRIVAVQNWQYNARRNMLPISAAPNKRSLKLREMDDSAKYGEIDIYPYSMSGINFTSKFFDKYPKHWLKNLLKLGLPCPCCGKNLPTHDEIRALPASGAFSGSCLAAINALEPYEDIMKPVEYNIMQIIKPLAQKYPGIDLQELMVLLSFEYESSLVGSQLTVLNNIKSIIPDVPEESQQELESTLKTAKEFILKKRKAPFKRKTFIKDIEEVLVNVDDRVLSNKIVREANKIPTSENSISAFILKYKERSPEEIGNRLIMFASATLEHITCESEGGEVTIWECQYCNNKRSNNDVVNQIEENPNMLDHLQSHIKVIVDRANFLKRHGGNAQAQKHYDYAQAIRDEYLINISKSRHTAERIEAEALEKLQFEEIPIPDDFIEKE